MADTVGEAMQKVWGKYKQLVSENPDSTGQVEAACRICSYLIAGRFEDSQVLSELVYSASNLLVLLNDAILQKASKIVPKVSMTQAHLMRFLTVLEYLEVFVELAAGRFWGETGRWIVIACIQIVKASLRFFLLIEHNSGIQPIPPIPALDRSRIIKSKEIECHDSEEAVPCDSTITSSATFTLKRSGKVVRTLAAAPPVTLRDWTLPQEMLPDNNNSKTRGYLDYIPSMLNKQRTWAESIYIARPIAHLFAMLCCSQNSWKPWLLSSGLDISSLCLMGDTSDLNPQEKGELKKRTFMLLYYLMRSPFYDRFSQANLVIMLNMLADHVPGTSLILKPLIEYLPAWQKVYFYVWGT